MKNWMEETRKEDYKRRNPKLMKIEMTTDQEYKEWKNWKEGD